MKLITIERKPRKMSQIYALLAIQHLAAEEKLVVQNPNTTSIVIHIPTEEAEGGFDECQHDELYEMANLFELTITPGMMEGLG